MSKIDNNLNTLYLFTSQFPYGNKEAFIGNEIPFLAKKFNKVVVISGAKKKTLINCLPKNVEVRSIIYDYKFSFKEITVSLFSRALINEIFLMVFFYKKLPTTGRIKTIIKSNANSFRLKNLYINEIDSKDSKVYLYSWWFNDSTIALSLMKKENPSLKVYTRAHRWDLYFEQNIYNYLPFRIQTCKHLDLLYSASKQGILYCKNKWKISKYNNLKLSRLGVKPQKFLELSSTKKIIVSCSNIIPIKRVEKIIKSISLIKTNDIKWVHFGSGLMSKKVEKMASKLLNKKVAFEFMGYFENNLLLKWYKENNPSLFINLSLSEGIPVSIMEAMSFGIPCIASSVGGCDELVTDSVGFPVSVNASSEDVSLIIDKFFMLPESEKKRLRKRAYNHIIENFNSTKNYTKFCESMISD